MNILKISLLVTLFNKNIFPMEIRIRHFETQGITLKPCNQRVFDVLSVINPSFN